MAVIDPVLQRQYLGNASQTGETEEIAGSSDDSQPDSEDEAELSGLSISAKLTRAQRAEVAQLLGDVLLRLNRVAEGIGYYQSARRLEKSAPERKLLAAKISSAKAELRLQSENTARLPVFHEALEQDRLVRPRLVARATQPVTSKGAVKP
jgi:cytochrome c-type biogenesis protein CcmH/NrfG